MNMRKIYRQIAKKYGVSVEDVKRDMQAAITQAYNNAPDNGVTKSHQDKVVRKGEIPTPDELILHVVNEIKDKK